MPSELTRKTGNHWQSTHQEWILKALKLPKPPLLWMTCTDIPSDPEQRQCKKIYIFILPTQDTINLWVWIQSPLSTSSQRLTWHKLWPQSSSMLERNTSHQKLSCLLSYSSNLGIHQLTNKLSSSQGVPPGTKISSFLNSLSVTLNLHEEERWQKQHLDILDEHVAASYTWLHSEIPAKNLTGLLLTYMYRRIPFLSPCFHRNHSHPPPITPLKNFSSHCLSSESHSQSFLIFSRKTQL